MIYYELDEIRKAWLKAALAQWERNIVDEDDCEEIVDMFKMVNWQWHLNADTKTGYSNRAKWAWCGHFQSVCGLTLGNYLSNFMSVPIMIDPDIAFKVLPSTQRMVSAGKWREAGYEKPAKTFEPDDESGGWVDKRIFQRMPIEEVFLPGAIAMIAARTYGKGKKFDKRNEIGGHYVCIESLEGDRVNTVEGNATGELPSGDWGEGVVRRRGEHARKVSDFKRVIHFSYKHFEFMGSE